MVMRNQISSLLSSDSGENKIFLFCACNFYKCLKFSQNKILSYIVKNKTKDKILTNNA